MPSLSLPQDVSVQDDVELEMRDRRESMSGEIWKVLEGFPFTCSLESTCLYQDVKGLAAKEPC